MPCPLKVPLAESRSTATLPAIDELNFVADSLKHLYCRHADVRFVVAHKGVVPENHAPAFTWCRFGPPSEPPVESLPGVKGQGTLARDTQNFLKQAPQQPGLQR